MFTAIFLALCQPGANEMNYNRIEFGMTRQQVAAIVRQAPVAKVTDDDRYSPAFTITSSLIRENGVLWRTGSRRLWVEFGRHQRVTGKMLEYDHVNPFTELFRKASSGSEPRR